MDGTAQPLQLALCCAMSAAHARVGADDAASGCYDGLVWRQCAHGIVLYLLEVVRWIEHRSLGEPHGMTGSASAPCLHAHAGSARRWPPQHAFDSESLASRAACSMTSSLSSRL
jgi:hypothetical protein